MNYKLVKEVFEDYSYVEDDVALARNTLSFVTGFMTKNESHINFFGGVLLGVGKVAYTPQDARMWLNEYLMIDDVKSCQRDLKELPDINAEFKVSSDIVNLSFIWVVYKLMNSNINETLKRDAMYAAINMAQIKHLTYGIFYKRFEHGADPLIAASLYESLDRKSDLKAQGSWLGLLQKKSEVFLEKSDGFLDVWTKMDNDRRVIELANEIRNRINKMLNKLTEKFYVIYEAQSQIKSGTKLAMVDGEQVLKDYESKPTRLVQDMESISRDENAFIKEELIDVTLGLVSTCSRVTLEKTLQYYTTNFYGDKQIKELQREIILYTLAATRRDKVKAHDIPSIVEYVRNMFRSSGTKNKDVLLIKAGLKQVATKANAKVKDNIIVSAQIALLLYVVLRSLTVKAYS